MLVCLGTRCYLYTHEVSYEVERSGDVLRAGGVPGRQSDWRPLTPRCPLLPLCPRVDAAVVFLARSCLDTMPCHAMRLVALRCARAGRVARGVPQAVGVPVHRHAVRRYGQPGRAPARGVRTVSRSELVCPELFRPRLGSVVSLFPL